MAVPTNADQTNNDHPTDQINAVPSNTVLHGDCLPLLRGLPDRCVDLVFADPPFNIGYHYDQYDDRRAAHDYLNWCRQWITEVQRVLRPSGTFWLAIGDEYAAELKVLATTEAQFYCRSWVIWYYTFGVNCQRGFSRSHTHLFHFVVDPENFTFNHENPAIRLPSARQLVYADRRANPRGRLPDNTWIIRPQDAPPSSFAAMHDTWYFARVAGTFKEREGFHGCQMPEQLLGRVIRISSQPRQLVLDPFAGSGTSLAVAKKLGRRWLGIELSEDYVRRIEQRLDATSVGDPLDGPSDPLQSAPSTAKGKRIAARIVDGRPLPPAMDENTELGILEAYRDSCAGNSTDALLCNPELNAEFVAACKRKDLPGSAHVWNRWLLRMRKSGKLPRMEQAKQKLGYADMDPYSVGSEIAMHMLMTDYAVRLDDILCHPDFAARFDDLAADFAPGFSPFQYRWAALALRKRAKQSKNLAKQRFANWLDRPLPAPQPLRELRARASGAYVLFDSQEQAVYAGEAIDVQSRLDHLDNSAWTQLGISSGIFISCPSPWQHGLQSMLIHLLSPWLNSELLRPRWSSRSVPSMR